MRKNAQITRLVREIESYGFSVHFVRYCEDAETPGLLGMIAGVTIWSKLKVKIRTYGRSSQEITETLKHELHHVTDPEWDCGNRNVVGRFGVANTVDNR